MEIPLQITFRNIERSEAVEARIREKVDKLEQYYDRITSCRVVVDSPHNHQHKGKSFSVRVDLTMPGDEIVVKRNPGADRAHEDVYMAIRDAFEAVRRQLKTRVRRLRERSHERSH